MAALGPTALSSRPAALDLRGGTGLEWRSAGRVAGIGPTLTERDLLGRAQDGDAGAFIEFYDLHARAVSRWFRWRTADADTAADLTAETFAELLDSIDGYDQDRSADPSGWLYGIARNKLRRWHRSQAVDGRARASLGVHSPTDGLDEMDLVELRMEAERLHGPLSDALAELSGPVRDAVLLRVVEERSYADVADALGCSEGAARVRVSRGLSALFDALAEEV